MNPFAEVVDNFSKNLRRVLLRLLLGVILIAFVVGASFGALIWQVFLK